MKTDNDIFEEIQKDIMNHLKPTGLVASGFVQDSTGQTEYTKFEELKVISKEYFKISFGISGTGGWRKNGRLQYARTVELISEAIAYDMAWAVVRLTQDTSLEYETIFNFEPNLKQKYLWKRLPKNDRWLQTLTLNKPTLHNYVVLYPVILDSKKQRLEKQDEKMLSTLMEKKLPNIYIQPFPLEKSLNKDMNTLFFLNTQPTAHGRLWFNIEVRRGFSENTVKITLHLFHMMKEK